MLFKRWKLVIIAKWTQFDFLLLLRHDWTHTWFLRHRFTFELVWRELAFTRWVSHWTWRMSAIEFYIIFFKVLTLYILKGHSKFRCICCCILTLVLGLSWTIKSISLRSSVGSTSHKFIITKLTITAKIIWLLSSLSYAVRNYSLCEAKCSRDVILARTRDIVCIYHFNKWFFLSILILNP